MAVLLAAAALLPWLVRRPAAARLRPLAVGAGVAVVVASPQLIAMAQQAISGGATVRAQVLAHTSKLYGVGLIDLFAPSQRVASFGLSGLAAATGRAYGPIAEGMPMFGLVLSVLALVGLAASWRRRSAWLLAALWLACAWLALGATLWIGRTSHAPFHQVWHGERVSPVMLYTWLMRVPGLSALREADRFALLGLVGAVLLAGSAVDWLLPTLPALDRPVAADHSDSIVVDVPFGLRGGIPLYGGQFAAASLVMATSDGHPRAVSYTSWVPAGTIARIKKHPFYTVMVRCQSWIPGKQVVVHASQSQLAAARRDARSMDIGWVLVWFKNPVVVRYLADIGFRLEYRVDGVAVYRPATR